MRLLILSGLILFSTLCFSGIVLAQGRDAQNYSDLFEDEVQPNNWVICGWLGRCVGWCRQMDLHCAIWGPSYFEDVARCRQAAEEFLACMEL